MAKPVMCMMQMGVLVSLGVTDLGFLGVPNVRSVNVTECVPRASEPECARMEFDGERENVGQVSTQIGVTGSWIDGRHQSPVHGTPCGPGRFTPASVPYGPVYGI